LGGEVILGKEKKGGKEEDREREGGASGKEVED